MAWNGAASRDVTWRDAAWPDMMLARHGAAICIPHTHRKALVLCCTLCCVVLCRAVLWCPMLR
eukprot:15219469-Heterocapsa_arctica.AAC.1